MDENEFFSRRIAAIAAILFVYLPLDLDGEKLAITLVDDAGHEYASAVRAPREYRFAWWKYLHGLAAIAQHVNQHHD